jgi:predicted O-methyltransferase YrrM
MIAKAARFLALVPTRPTEAVDRLLAATQARWELRSEKRIAYKSCSALEACELISRSLGVDLLQWSREPASIEIESLVRKKWGEIQSYAPFRTAHNGDICLARTCYSLVRAIRPAVVVETGVCYGVTSSFVLQALHCNGAGSLHSIDLPPLESRADDFVGCLIPENLRSRWTLHRGTARRLLPSVLRETGPIDLFVHDSLHTYENMKMEFQLAWESLRPGGILIADDIQANAAFQELSNDRDAEASAVFAEEEKNVLCGVVIKRP